MLFLLAVEFGGGSLVEGVLPLDYSYYSLGNGFLFEVSSGYFMFGTFAAIDERKPTGYKSFSDMGFVGGVDFSFFPLPFFSFGTGALLRTVPVTAYRWEAGLPVFVQMRLDGGMNLSLMFRFGMRIFRSEKQFFFQVVAPLARFYR